MRVFGDTQKGLEYPLSVLGRDFTAGDDTVVVTRLSKIFAVEKAIENKCWSF